MLILADGRVWLEAGETIPVYCVCGEIYQPVARTVFSRCPQCHRVNDHDKGHGVALVPFEKQD